MSGKRNTWLLALVGVVTAAIVGIWVLQPEHRRKRASQDVELRAASERARGSEHRLASRASPSAALARIRGRIIDPSGGPLAEGRVDLHCTGAAHASSSIDEDGWFEGPACAAGPTCVRLVHPGVEQPRAWEIESGAEVELEAQPAPRLSGTIVSPGGEAVAGAELLVMRGATRVAIGSDAAGEFAIALPRLRPCDRCDVEPSECRADPQGAEIEQLRVLVSTPSFAPTEVEVAFADAVNIVLVAAAPALAGRVLARDGEPFDRTRVLAINRARDYEQHAVEADAQGNFAFVSLADAEYSLRAIRDERELATVTLARPGDDVVLRSELVARGSALTVEIVDASGDTIPGARVDGGPWRAAISDAEGRVEASAVLPGIYTVRVRAGDCGAVREAITLEPDVAAWLRRVQLPENC